MMKVAADGVALGCEQNCVGIRSYSLLPSSAMELLPREGRNCLLWGDLSPSWDKATDKPHWVVSLITGLTQRGC